MELSQLIYFRTTARTEHFTRAAEQLHITQPSLSKAIANLEEELGTPLFDREGKRVRLNAYGQAFLEWVDQILASTEDAKFMVQDMKQGERGSVHIGSSFPITPPSPLHYFQYEYFHQHPKVALSVHTHSAVRLESMLENRELDYGISLSPSTRIGIASVPLYTDILGIIVSPNHRLAGQSQVRLEELSQELFLCNSSGPDPHDSARNLCARVGFIPNIIYEGESAELIGEAVSHGRGISFVSRERYKLFHNRALAPDWERDLIFVALEDPICIRTIYLHYRSSGYYSRASTAFREELLEYLASHPYGE